MRNKLFVVGLCLIFALFGTACNSKSNQQKSSGEEILYSSFNVNDFISECVPKMSANMGETFLNYLGGATDMDNGEEELRYYSGPKYNCMNCGEAENWLDITSAKEGGNISSISVSHYNKNGICELCIRSFIRMTIPPVMIFFEDTYNEEKLEQATDEMCNSLQFNDAEKVTGGYATMSLENGIECSFVASNTSVFALFKPTENGTQNKTSQEGEKKASTDDNVLRLSDFIKTNYDTGYQITVKYAISDKDYKMYNDILDALNSDFSKSEDEILAGLTGKYGMSVSQLKAFMTKNMDAAIDRDYGKTIGASTISDLQAIDCGKQVIINTIENSDIKIPSDTASWDISKTGLRYVLKCSFKVDESNLNEAIIKIEFNEDYSKFTLFQLKYNGVDIEL